MRIIKFNGECWYETNSSLWRRALEWVVWIGGARVFKLLVEADGPMSVLKHWHHLTPISVLGHRATFFGNWFQVRLSSGILVVRFERENEPGYAFISPDGTPQKAHTWIGAAPAEIIEAAAAASTPERVAAARAGGN